MAKKKRVESKPREYTKRQLSSHRRQQRRQRFIFFGGIAIVVAVVAIILGGWIVGEYIPLHKTVIEVFEKKFDTSFYIDTMVILSHLQSSGDVSQVPTYAMNQITSDELLIQEAEKLGFTVSDEEARQFLERIGFTLEINEAAIHLAKGTLLPDKLKSGYFSSLVPTTDNQVHVKAMLVESESVARSLRERIMNGENFSMLAEEYAHNTPSIENKGDFGWHPPEILKDLIYSDIPIEYITRPGVAPGDVSPPLADNQSSKNVGYWLIRVNERPTVDSANVSAVFLGSEEEALDIRAKLEAGEELSVIAANFSQHSLSKAGYGELGILQSSDYISEAFNEYVFAPATEIGVWSQPVHDDALWTKGGYWVVQLVDKDENRELSQEDRNTIINELYTDWITEKGEESAPLFINHLTNDAELQQWAIDKAAQQL